MKRIGSLLAAAVLAYGATASAAEVAKGEDFSLDVGGRLQLSGVVQQFDDPFRDDTRMYMFLKQARLNVQGRYHELEFKISTALGGEEEVKAPSPGVSLGLLDLYADIGLPLGETRVRVGQFKVPYSLERLTDPTQIMFIDRSVMNMAFEMGRDYGAAVHSNFGDVKGAVGIFSGGGRNVPERYLPLILGVPMVVGRVGYDNGLYRNAFAEPAANVEGAKVAAYVNAFYLQDSQIGHSTVLNVRMGERSLLANPNWNPYIGRAPTSRGDLWQVGADVSARFEMGPGIASAQLEVNHGQYKNAHGDLRMTGGRAQVAYNWQKWEGALRFATVLPDAEMANSGTSIAGGRLFNEITPAVSYTHSKNVRVVADLPIQINAPVMIENNVGTYLLTDHPDQVTLLKPGANGAAPSGTGARENIVAARLMVEAKF
jgi:hypothetical protein